MFFETVSNAKKMTANHYNREFLKNSRNRNILVPFKLITSEIKIDK